jgi:flagellar biosynthesis protein FlhF
MKLESFRGTDSQRVFEAARVALGDDVMVIRTRSYREDGRGVFEILATTPAEVAEFERLLEAEPLPLHGRTARRGSARPLVVALVGPTGAGKTTTIAKLAAHPRAFGDRSVGLLTLDTYRVGAVEQLAIVADLAGLPLEVAYAPGDVAEAMRRLAACDVVLVDTPGRSPRADRFNVEWGAMLAEARPDEVHLVLPAVLRGDIADAVGRSFASHGLTHLLMTKIDEVPGEAGVADLAAAMRLPARWITDGQEIPTDLRPAAPRILASLGISPTADLALRSVA